MAHGNGHDNAPESPAAQGPTLRVDSPAALRAAAASTMQAGAHARLPSQCRAELAQEREANEEAQKQLASLQQQLDGEQERSRELESANAQFIEGINRLRNERNALQAQCNELKKERAPAVVPLGVNNGRVSSFFRR